MNPVPFLERLLIDYNKTFGLVMAPFLVMGVTAALALWMKRFPQKALKWGGIFASLPFVVGPLLLCVAYNFGDTPPTPERIQFAQQEAFNATANAIWGILAYLAFCAACALSAVPLSKALPRLPATIATISSGVLAFVLVAALLNRIPHKTLLVPLPILLVILCLLRFPRLLEHMHCDGRKAPSLNLYLEIVLKGAAAFGLCLLFRHIRMGDNKELAGIVSLFPTATGVMLFSCLFTAGPEGLRHQLSGVSIGACGLLTYLVCFLATVTLMPPLYAALLSTVPTSLVSFYVLQARNRKAA